VQPAEGGAHILLLAAALVMFAFAEPGAAKVETQRCEAELVHDFGRTIYDLVVHGAATLGVRMADQRGVSRLWPSFYEERFKVAGWARDGERLQTIGDACHRS
jgi:hypothetical protein